MRTIREAVLGMRRAPALTILSVMAIGLSVFSIGLFASRKSVVGDALPVVTIVRDAAMFPGRLAASVVDKFWQRIGEVRPGAGHSAATTIAIKSINGDPGAALLGCQAQHLLGLERLGNLLERVLCNEARRCERQYW